MATDILYRGTRPVKWRYFHCVTCGTVFRDDTNRCDASVIQCPVCGEYCSDISYDEALRYVPSGQCIPFVI